jgi:hypothetical protein
MEGIVFRQNHMAADGAIGKARCQIFPRFQSDVALSAKDDGGRIEQR